MSVSLPGSCDIMQILCTYQEKYVFYPVSFIHHMYLEEFSILLIKDYSHNSKQSLDHSVIL